MIKFVQGNIFDSNAQALVNPVNCVGKMGKGLALEFKTRYPGMYRIYKAQCDDKRLFIGQMLTYTLFGEDGNIDNYQYIINFPTKLHWINNSQYRYIKDGLEALVIEVKKLGIKSIAIPSLGCGLGGLDWHIVKEQISKAFKDLEDVEVMVYEPR